MHRAQKCHKRACPQCDILVILLRLSDEALHSFVDDSQVFPFHLVVQEAVSDEFGGQFWYKHILVQYSLDTSIGQSYLCTEPFKV